MELPNTLSGGMNLDVHPSKQPANTTREVTDCVIYSEEGNVAYMSSEKGLGVGVTLPDTFAIIGKVLLVDRLYVILANPAGYSQFGYINMLNSVKSYVPLAPVGVSGVPVDNNEFGFTLGHPVDMVARKLIDGTDSVYFTDNNVPFGVITLNDLPKVGSVKKNVGLIPTMSIPVIDFLGLEEGGQLRATSYFFITRYVLKSGGYTAFGIMSNPILVTSSNLTDKNTDFKGDNYKIFNDQVDPIVDTERTVNKKINLKFSNVDTQYSQMEVIVVYYNQDNVNITTRASVININGQSEILYSFSGVTDETVTLTFDELNEPVTTYETAKCIEQKDNILFLSNLSGVKEDALLLQSYANQIVVKPFIDEVLYSERESDANIVLDGFYPTRVNNSGENTIVITMSEPVSATNAITVNSLIINNTATLYGPIAACKSITVDAIAFASDFQVVINGIVLTGSLSSNVDANFSVAVQDDNVVADNLSRCINRTLDNQTNYIHSRVIGNVVYVYYTNWTDILVGDSLSIVVAAHPAQFAVASVNNASVNGVVPLNFPLANIGNDILCNTGLYLMDYVNTTANISLIYALDNLTTHGDDVAVRRPLSQGTLPSTVTGSKPIDDYINPSTCFYKKGYMRDEVYSLGFYLVYKNGSKSNVYHIPAPDRTGLSVGKNHISGDTTNTYLSSINYPILQGYPTGGIRHHLMPTLSEQPHFRKVGNSTFIRILGLRFIVPTALTQVKDLAEIVYVREQRDSYNKRSLHGQGLLTNLVITAHNFNGDADNNNVNIEPQGLVNKNDEYVVQPIPLCNTLRLLSNGRIGDSKPGGEDKIGPSDRGIAYPGSNKDGLYRDKTKLATEVVNNQVMFYSPETTLNYDQISVDTAITGGFKTALKMKAEVSFFTRNWFERFYSRQMSAAEITILLSGIGTSFVNSKEGFYQKHYTDAYKMFNFKDCEASDSLASYQIEDVVDTISGSTSRSRHLFNSAETSLSDPKNFKLDMKWSSRGLHARIDNTLGRANNRTVVFNSRQREFHTSENDNEQGGYFSADYGDTLYENLYNFETSQTDLYGNIGSGKYIVAHRNVQKDINSNVYGGDTFITKYAMMNGAVITKYPLKARRNLYSGIWYDVSHNYVGAVAELAKTQPHPFPTDQGTHVHFEGSEAEGSKIKDICYFFVESRINTYYRSVPEKELNEGKKLYYPYNNNPLDLLVRWPSWRGNVENYNGAYSNEPSQVTYFTRSETTPSVQSYPCRTIYSNIAKADSVSDSYRDIGVLNYYDLPSNTGEIWDSFVFSNTLFLHTPKALWRTFAENQYQIQSLKDGAAVTLGTGALFYQPATVVNTADGGYGGTMSQWGGCETPMGYIFPDVKQNKVFVTGITKVGPTLTEVSNKGLMTWFKDKMLEVVDNPYMGSGVCSIYDYRTQRFLLTYMVSNALNPSVTNATEFTVSLSGLTSAWTSFHTHLSRLYVQHDDKCYGGDSVAEFGKGNYQQSRIKISTPSEKMASFTNVVIDGYSKDDIGNDLPLELSTVLYSNNIAASGSSPSNVVTSEEKAVNEVFIKRRNQEYRIAIPRNVKHSTGFYIPTDDEYHYSPRIKGNYMIGDYRFSPAPFALSGITTIFDINTR